MLLFSLVKHFSLVSSLFLPLGEKFYQSTISTTRLEDNFLFSNERQVINTGGTGIVSHYPSLDTLVVKQSYPFTKEKIKYECSILQKLQSIPNIERCLGTFPLPEKDVQISLLSPFIDARSEPIYSSIAELIDPSLIIKQSVLRQLTLQLFEAVVGMIGKGIVTSDVQLLVQPNTKPSPTFLMVDFTEAIEINQMNPSPEDLQAITAFLLEVNTLLPSHHILHNFILNADDITSINSRIQTNIGNNEIQEMIRQILLS
eukprot:gene5133-5498_t